MGETEKNRQVVQDGLNKRKARRKKAEEEAYQESITTQMIDVVNKNAHRAEEQKQTEINNAISERQKRLHNKKVARLQEKRDTALISIFISLMLFAVSAICYATEITELWNVVVAVVLTAIMFVISTYFAVGNAIKLARLA